MLNLKKIKSLSLFALVALVAMSKDVFASEIDLKIPSLDVAYNIFGYTVTGSQVLLYGLGICVFGLLSSVAEVCPPSVVLSDVVLFEFVMLEAVLLDVILPAVALLDMSFSSQEVNHVRLKTNDKHSKSRVLSVLFMFFSFLMLTRL